MKLSFVMPAYNAQGFIEDAIKSIYMKNFVDGDELIVVEDGSSDRTGEIVDKLQKKYGFKVIWNKSNLGCQQSRNIGIKSAINPYIFNLDADDVLAPKSITVLIDNLIKNQADVVAFGESWFFKNNIHQITHKWIYPAGWYTLADFFSGNRPPGGNFLYKKSIWQDIGGYTELKSSLHEFWGFTLKFLVNKYKYFVVPNTHYFHRVQHDSIFSRSFNNEDYYEISRKVGSELIKPALTRLDDNAKLLIEKDPRWFDHLNEQPLMRGRKTQVKYTLRTQIDRWIYKLLIKPRL